MYKQFSPPAASGTFLINNNTLHYTLTQRRVWNLRFSQLGKRGDTQLKPWICINLTCNSSQLHGNLLTLTRKLKLRDWTITLKFLLASKGLVLWQRRNTSKRKQEAERLKFQAPPKPLAEWTKNKTTTLTAIEFTWWIHVSVKFSY